MESCVAYSVKPQADDAADEVVGKIKGLVSEPKLILLYASAATDVDLVRSVLESEFADVPFVGISSSKGVVTSDGHFGGEGAFLGALAIGGRGIDAGVAVADLAGNPREAAKALSQKAMADAGKQVAPDFWFMLSSSRKAGVCIDGVAEVIGVAPLCGGGATEVESKVFAADGVFQEGCAVVFVYSKAQFVSSFESCLGNLNTDAIQDALQGMKSRRVPPVARSIKVHLSGVVAANPAIQPPVMYAMALDEKCLPSSSDGRESFAHQLAQATDGAPFMTLLMQEEYGVRDGSYCVGEAGLSFATIG